MPPNLYKMLKKMEKDQCVPTIIAYNRIDGPGSSLDLREFQQAMWTMPKVLPEGDPKPNALWSKNLPRTIGITIDIGTKIEVHPYDKAEIAIKSMDYNIRPHGRPGIIPPNRNNWLLKIIELFGLQGVCFLIKNLRPGTLSSGLGGSATVATGVCLLANEIAGRPFDKTQLISIASRMEQDLGVSITGTQEQSNVVYGGVMDYIWFPWGIPGKLGTGYGDSIRYELVSQKSYNKIEERMAIYHTGINRLSTNVNRVWRAKLFSKSGYQLHLKKINIAYTFREALRLQKWNMVKEAIDMYRDIRTYLSPDYMIGAEDLAKRANDNGCSVFPLGAGGGGSVLVISEKPKSIKILREEFVGLYKEIPFKVKPKGHEFLNIREVDTVGGS